MKKEKIEAIITANEYIDKLINGIEWYCEQVYSGKEKEGMERMPEIIDGIEYIYKIVKLTDNIFSNMNNIDKIRPYFEEIVTALEGEDYILSGDLYKYEIIPILKEIKESFIKVIES